MVESSKFRVALLTMQQLDATQKWKQQSAKWVKKTKTHVPSSTDPTGIERGYELIVNHR